MNYLEYFNVTKESILENSISKNSFYSNGNLKKSDKELFVNGIEKIIWQYSLKEESEGFRSYTNDNIEYDEIEVIRVILKEDCRYKKIAEIIQKTIPYPMIIIFELGNKVLFNTAFKRINKNDDNKNIAEEFNYTNWIDIANPNNKEIKFLKSLNIKNVMVNDFYKLYEEITNKIIIFNTSIYEEGDTNIENKDIEEIKAIKAKIDNIIMEIEKAKRQRDKEKQLNKRIDYQMKIKKLEIEKEKLILSLNK